MNTSALNDEPKSLHHASPAAFKETANEVGLDQFNKLQVKAIYIRLPDMSHEYTGFP